jgi:hypothetical protein
MKVGANNKRNIYILGALVVVGIYVLWTNVFSGSSNDDSTRTTAANHAPPQVAQHVAPAGSAVDPTTRRRENPNGSAEWKVVYKTGQPIDPIKVDPTLRMDILKKVQSVEIATDTQRNLFQFGPAPPPLAVGKLPDVKQIAINKRPYGPEPPPKPPGPAAPETAPPINLKYYGFATPRANGAKRAFFLDNEDIIVAAEGELIKRRYKVLKIGVNTVTMEDTQFKSEQQLPLVPDAAS